MVFLHDAVAINSLHTIGRQKASESMPLAPPPDYTTARLHREWLRSLPGLTGKSLSRIAEEVGIARTTLTNKIKPDDPGTSTLNGSIIERIVRYHKVPGPGGAPVPAGIALRGLSEDAAPYAAASGSPLDEAVRALIAGRNGIDPWTVKSRALELFGILPGDVVLVDLNATPRPGDAVCAQVYDWPRDRADTVMRVFERAAPVDVLTARSLDPGVGPPLVVDGERVVVRGVILPHRLGRQ